MGKYIDHRLIARLELDIIFWTDTIHDKRSIGARLSRDKRYLSHESWPIRAAVRQFRFSICESQLDWSYVYVPCTVC